MIQGAAGLLQPHKHTDTEIQPSLGDCKSSEQPMHKMLHSTRSEDLNPHIKVNILAQTQMDT